jgi:hypothetical protein
MKVKTYLLLNVFFVLTIFVRGNETLPFVIESSGAIELSQMKITIGQHILLAGTFTNTLTYAGQTLSSVGEEDIFLMSINPDGQLLWMKSFGGVFDDDISVLTIDGESIWLAGGFRDQANFDTLTLDAPDGSRSLFLLKLAANGNLLLHKQLDGLGLKSITGIGIGKEGDLFMGGFFRAQLTFDNQTLEAKGTTDLFVIKLNNNRNLSVIAQYGEKGNTRIEHLIMDVNEQLVIGGTFDNQLVLGADTLVANTLDKDVFIANLNLEGQVQWSLKAGGVFDKELVKLAVDPDGHIYGGGQLVGVMQFSEDLMIQSQNGNTDTYWFELAPSGQPLRASAFGGTDAEILTDLDWNDGHLWLSGSFQGGFKIDGKQLEVGLGIGSFLLKLDGNTGMAVEAESISTSVAAFIYQLDFWNDGKVLAAGSFGGKLDINGQELDAGPFFFGLVTSFDLRSTSIRNRAFLDIRLYPNPFRDRVWVESSKAIKRIWIYDVSGRLHWASHYTSGELSLSFIKNGLYQILIETVDGGVARQWIIKQ